MSYMYILERLIQTSKIIIFQLVYSSSGSWVAGSYPSSLGHKEGSTLDRTPFHHRVHSHTPTHSSWDNVDMPVHLTWTSLGCWRKPGYPEKTHVDKGRTCNRHTDSEGSQESVIFLNVNNNDVEQSYSRTCCNT